MSLKNITYPWRVTIKIQDPLMIKYKKLSNVHLSSHLGENETILMYLPYHNVEEAFEYCKNLGIKTCSLGRADIESTPLYKTK